MAGYKVKQGNIFGRIGSGIGEGLGQQIPKEIDRQRLQAGLEDLSQNSGSLTPFQRFAKLSGIPGATPQMVESGSRLLEREAQRNAYRNPMSGEQIAKAPANSSPMPRQDVVFSPTKAGIGKAKIDQPRDRIPEGFSSRAEQAAAGEKVTNENPTNKKFLPVSPWSPERRDDEIGRELVRDPALTLEQASQRVADNERRYLEAPTAEQQKYDYLRRREKEADAELDNQLQVSLQKDADSIYADLTGDTLLDLKKAMHNDLQTTPGLGVKQAAEKWRRAGKDFVESKNLMKTLADRDLDKKLLPSRKDDTIKSLVVARKFYKDMGKSREFYNTLKSDFGLSPGGAAIIAYPRSQGLKAVLKENEKGKFPVLDTSEKSRQFGKLFLEKGTAEDSVLAFMKSAKNKFPSFDGRAYMQYLQDNMDQLTPNQRKEVQENVVEIFPNWGDLALFPFNGRSPVDD